MSTHRKLYYKDSDFKIVDRITEIAKQHGVSNAQIALAWLLAQPGITAPIIGASKTGTARRPGEGARCETERRGA